MRRLLSVRFICWVIVVKQKPEQAVSFGVSLLSKAQN